MSSDNKNIKQVLSKQEAELSELGDSREDRGRKARLYLDIGDNYEIVGERDKALNCYKESLRISGELKENLMKAKAYQRLGSTKAEMFLFPAAIAHYEKAIEIADKIFNNELLGDLYRGLGGIYHRIGANDRAIEYFAKSAEKANLVKDSKTLIKDYDQLRLIHEEKGDFKNALFYYELVLDCLRTIDDPMTKAKVINNIGMLCYIKGEYEKAIERFEELKRFGEELQFKAAVGRALVNGSHAYAKIGQLDKAEDYNKKGEEIFKKLKDRNMLAGVKLNFALIHAAKQDWDKSISAFDEIFEDLKDLYAPFLHGIMRYEFGLVLKKIGKREEAKTQLEEALESFEEVWAVNFIDKVEKELATV